ncbi:unnamed protein product [Cylicocyclus nassatus]|uniref:Transposase n=1 Tax=Cylicocyclus nassatus TaxID=53992 RepID=A0AA36GP56_CYLNA|nr:unnamed protein product [Cylicocyclus nassatus]
MFYVTERDIPEHLLRSINVAIETFSVNTTVAAPDVVQYINFYMQKYFGRKGWNILDANFPEEEEIELLEAAEGAGEAQQEVDLNRSEEFMDQSILSTSVKHADSGSSYKATSDSNYTPEKEPRECSDSDAFPGLDETKPHLLDKYYLVQGRKLMELFYLNLCGCDNTGGTVRLLNSGSAPIIEYVSKEGTSVKRWEGQEKLGSRPNDKLYSGNAIACAAALTTGARMNKIQKWAEEANVLVNSKTAFYCIFDELATSVDIVYEKHQKNVIQKIRAAYEDDGVPTSWNIAVDGAFDSRGFTAKICRVLAVDLRTNLCIHTEVVHYSETANISGRMEKEGFRRMLRWLRSNDIPIHSIATDRSSMYGSEIASFNGVFDKSVEWFFDPWHLGRYLYKNLRAAQKRGIVRRSKTGLKTLKPIYTIP